MKPRPRDRDAARELTAGVAVGAMLAAAGLSCAGDAPVRPQWLVTLRTDAPLPLVADRVLVEVTRADGALACASCRRILDASRPDAWPISFGVAASAPPFHVRARLHRARKLGPEGTPDLATTIDARAALPPEPGPVAIELRMRCVGVPSTLDESCAPATGELAPVAEAAAGAGDPAVVPGSWSEASSPPCASAAPPEMVCVDGGLFFFGAFEREEGDEDQLVRLSSFFLDRDEMTVGRARALFASGAIAGRPTLRGSGRSPESVCAFLGDADARGDELALNCVDRELARELCAADGKRLPTDAELAYVAGNGARGTRYPWGDEEDICARAVVARGALPFELDDGDVTIECRSTDERTLPFGPARGGSPADVTVSPAGIMNLGGNLAEWVDDAFGPLGGACWSGRPLLVDPVCRVGGDAVLRGGAWAFEAWTASARFRVATTVDGASSVGFRCARAAR
ncbi:MAG: SUMF1/EgtB/PvdO family nonheme iron enzyme [Labilithrix sp.]|nr:SUMF1/EgtB/PvdO family nonheme iron enzyme [Labilithrix sp.]